MMDISIECSDLIGTCRYHQRYSATALHTCRQRPAADAGRPDPAGPTSRPLRFIELFVCVARCHRLISAVDRRKLVWNITAGPVGQPRTDGRTCPCVHKTCTVTTYKYQSIRRTRNLFPEYLTPIPPVSFPSLPSLSPVFSSRVQLRDLWQRC